MYNIHIDQFLSPHFHPSQSTYSSFSFGLSLSSSFFSSSFFLSSPPSPSPPSSSPSFFFEASSSEPDESPVLSPDSLSSSAFFVSGGGGASPAGESAGESAAGDSAGESAGDGEGAGDSPSDSDSELSFVPGYGGASHHGQAQGAGEGELPVLDVSSLELGVALGVLGASGQGGHGPDAVFPLLPASPFFCFHSSHFHFFPWYSFIFSLYSFMSSSYFSFFAWYSFIFALCSPWSCFCKWCQLLDRRDLLMRPFDRGPLGEGPVSRSLSRSSKSSRSLLRGEDDGGGPRGFRGEGPSSGSSLRWPPPPRERERHGG